MILHDKKIGIIGAGNMGSAIIAGVSKMLEPGNITIFDIDNKKTGELNSKYKVNAASSIDQIASGSDIIIIAVKPDDVRPLLSDLKKSSNKSVVVSIAAGVTIKSMEEALGPERKIVRVMPNTPCIIGEGASAISHNDKVDEETLKMVEKIFSMTGITVTVQEKLMDAVTGLSGSGPAYVYTFINALTDGGVKMGLSRDKALLLAAQTVAGSARLVMQTMEHPMNLRGMVTSPGGTTIEGIHVIERSGFSGIVMDAVEAATKKSKALGEK